MSEDSNRKLAVKALTGYEKTYEAVFDQTLKDVERLNSISNTLEQVESRLMDRIQERLEDENDQLDTNELMGTMNFLSSHRAASLRSLNKGTQVFKNLRPIFGALESMKGHLKMITYESEQQALEGKKSE